MAPKLTVVFVSFAIQLFRPTSFTAFEVGDSSYWARGTPHSSLFSLRSSHIGPIPRINQVMTEWSKWGFWGKCTRSCGGGVRSRTRTCIKTFPRVMPGSGIRTSHDHCAGETVQYEVCGSNLCPAGQVSRISFRAAQCRRHNNKKVLGRVINSWVPYTQGSINPCALVCEGEGEGIVYTFGKVTDGTYCTTEKARQGLCVNGRCLRLSCDGRLGGSAFEDMCRVCGGHNDTCTRHSGIFHSERPSADQPFPGSSSPAKKVPKKIKSFGYFEVTQIPSGSTNVKVIDNSSNFLALKSGDKYLLNGDWLIDWPGEIDAAGVSFTYSRKEDQSEALTSLGPTNSDLALMVLLREENPGIYYEYWTQNTKLKNDLKSGVIPTDVPASLKVLNTFSKFVPVSSTMFTSTTISPTTSSSLTPKARTTSKPVILSSSNLNKTFVHTNNVIQPPPKLKPTNHKTRKDGITKHQLPSKSKWKSKTRKTTATTHEKYQSTIFNPPKASSSKLRAWQGNSVYGVLHPTKIKSVQTDAKYSLTKKKNFGEDYTGKNNYYEKKKKKRKKKKRKRPKHCKPCIKKRKTKRSFCISDFVSRVRVLSGEETSHHRRIEVLVLQSYKNKVPLLHKEFLWQDKCSCRRLRKGRSYIVMGSTERTRGNEVKLVLRQEDFVRRFSHKILTRVMRIRSNEMKFCRPWRRRHFSTSRQEGSSNREDFLDRFFRKRSETDAKESVKI